MTTVVGEGLLGPGETARLLEISTVHLARLAKAGALAHVSTPLGRLYRREDVEQLRREREGAASAE